MGQGEAQRPLRQRAGSYSFQIVVRTPWAAPVSSVDGEVVDPESRGTRMGDDGDS